MDSLNRKILGRVVQNGGFCFEPTDPCDNCDEQGSCFAVGQIDQLAFENRFLLEDMDYAFLSDARVQYRAREPFVELLCLDSIDAMDSGNGQGAASVRGGIHVNYNRETQGELRFGARVPIRGVRIVIHDRFLKDELRDRFPAGALDFLFFGRAKSGGFQHPGLRLIFSQIKNSIHSGVDCEVYYESKIIEILCLLSSLNTAVGSPRLSAEDLTAVEEVRTILEERFSDAPPIARLAVITGTGRAKLQADFKAAFGCTIHDYLQSVRMARALDAVEHTQIPLYLVAREVGYKNPGHFSELFRVTYGITPDLYRKNLS